MRRHAFRRASAEMPEIEGAPGHPPVARKRKSPGVSGAFASIQFSELYGSTPYGSRTRVIGLRIRYPGPLDEGGEGQRCIGQECESSRSCDKSRVPQLAADLMLAAGLDHWMLRRAITPQHFLNFLPLPQEQGSLRPTLTVPRTNVPVEIGGALKLSSSIRSPSRTD